MNQLISYRKNINKIDDSILNLLNKRLKITNKMGEYKKRNNLKINDESGEKEIFNKLKEKSEKHGLSERYIKEVFKKIIRNSKENQK